MPPALAHDVEILQRYPDLRPATLRHQPALPAPQLQRLCQMPPEQAARQSNVHSNVRIPFQGRGCFIGPVDHGAITIQHGDLYESALLMRAAHGRGIDHYREITVVAGERLGYQGVQP